MLLTPFLRETRTLHVNGAALGGVQQLSLAVVQNLERRGRLLGSLRTRNIRSRRAVRTIKVQRLRSEQGATALGYLANNGGYQVFATLLVAIVTPHLDNILLCLIQGVRRNLDGTCHVTALVSESQLLVVILNDVADSQNRSVRTLLAHNNLNTLRGVNITLKTPTREIQNLIVIGILQSVVAPVGSELIRSSNRRILTDTITRQSTGRCSCRSICGNSLGKRRRHRQDHRASQHQCTASLRRPEERRLRVRKSGHKHSLSVEPIALMQVVNRISVESAPTQ